MKVRKKTRCYNYLIWICSPESLQSFSNSGNFSNKRFNIGLLKNGFIVVNVSELDNDPGVSNVVLVVVVILAFVVHLINISIV